MTQDIKRIFAKTLQIIAKLLPLHFLYRIVPYFEKSFNQRGNFGFFGCTIAKPPNFAELLVLNQNDCSKSGKILPIVLKAYSQIRLIGLTI